MKGSVLKLHPLMIMSFIYVCFFVSACASNNKGEETSVYQSSVAPMADVQYALDKAKKSDKLLLIVMGAQWCHDSRSLATNFADPKVAEILQQYYQLIYVDVAYFKDLRPISNRFGQAHYFATPTVMIIDPHSEQLINSGDLAIWGSADTLPLSRYIEYFSTYAEVNSTKSSPLLLNVSAENLAMIKDFEKTQGERLQYAYGVLVPDMLREDLTGAVNQTFLDRWSEVRSYRIALQKDIQSLYQQAKQNVNTPLTLPQYPPFSWE